MRIRATLAAEQFPAAQRLFHAFEVDAARDPKTDQRWLLKLVLSPFWQVRAAVAGNKNAPVRALLQLGRDPQQAVYEVALKHKSLIWSDFVKIGTRPALVRAAGDKATPPAVLARMARNCKYPDVAAVLAKNKALPVSAMPALKRKFFLA